MTPALVAAGKNTRNAAGHKSAHVLKKEKDADNAVLLFFRVLGILLELHPRHKPSVLRKGDHLPMRVVSARAPASIFFLTA